MPVTIVVPSVRLKVVLVPLVGALHEKIRDEAPPLGASHDPPSDRVPAIPVDRFEPTTDTMNTVPA